MFARFSWALTAVFAVIASSASAQSATSVVQGSTTIMEPVSLTVNQVLTIVAVTPPTAGAQGAGGGGAGGGAGGAGLAGQPNGGAPIIGYTPTRYEVRDGGGQTLSIAVPQTLELIQVDGDDQMTLNTSTGIVTGSGMDLLGGPLGAEGALSFAVADRAELYSDTDLGNYSGLLILTAQYN